MAKRIPDVEVLEDDVNNLQSEIGASGVMILSGDVFNMEDYVPELRGERAMAKYEEMWYSDPQIDGALFHLRSPITSGTWIIDPYKSEDDGKGNKKPSDQDKKVAEFIRQWTIEADPLDDGTGWAGFLDQVLSMMTVFGHFVCEKRWGTTRVGGYQVIEKYAPRDPKSIQLFHVGTDRRLEYVEQYAYGPNGYDRFRIKAERLIPFVLRKRGDNWWGRSLIRSCYMPWSIWRQLAIIDAMRHERHGMGIPVLEVPPGGGSKQMELAKKVVKELRAHERQYVKLPPGFKLTWYFPTGAGTDIIRSMEYWDGRKARALMNEISTYGSGNVGGNRSLGQTVERAMLGGVQGLAMQVSSTLKKYAIGAMVRNNFGDDVGVPTARIEDLDALDIKDLAAALKSMRDGDFIEPDDSLETFLRSKLHITTKEPETARPKQLLAAIPTDGGDGGDGTGVGQTDSTDGARGGPKPAKTGVKPAAAMHPRVRRPMYAAARVLPNGMRREMFDHERACAFTEIMDRIATETDAAWGTTEIPGPVAKIRSKQIDEIAADVASKDAKDLSKKLVRYPRIGALADAVFTALRDAYKYGRQTIRDEMVRQRLGAEPTRPDTSTPLITGAISDLLEPTNKELARVRRLAEMYAEEQTEALVKRGVDVALRAKLLGLVESQIEFRVLEALHALSEAMVQSALQGDIVASFTFGRNDAMARVETEISTTYYSAIMDEGTCAACEALDGQEHEFGDDRYITPNPNCAWPPHCRCVTIPVFKRPEEGEGGF